MPSLKDGMMIEMNKIRIFNINVHYTNTVSSQDKYKQFWSLFTSILFYMFFQTFEINELYNQTYYRYSQNGTLIQWEHIIPYSNISFY